jgi:WD40 repeat protein
MIVLQGAKERVDVLEFSPDGQSLVAPFRDGVQIWHDVSVSAPTVVLNHRWVWSVRFTLDGRKLLLAGERGSLVIHDLHTTKFVNVPLQLKQSGVYCELSPDGKSFLVAQGDTLAKPPGRISCFKLANPTVPVWSIRAARNITSPPLFLPKGNQFMVFEWHGEPPDYWQVVVTRRTRTGGTVGEKRVAGEPLFYSPILSHDRTLLAGRLRGWLGILDTNALGSQPVKVRNNGKKEFTGMAFHPSGRYLAATSNDATVKLFETATWKVRTAFDWQIGRLRSVAFSPDGMRAAAGGDSGQIVIWDVDR